MLNMYCTQVNFILFSTLIATDGIDMSSRMLYYVDFLYTYVKMRPKIFMPLKFMMSLNIKIIVGLL